MHIHIFKLQHKVIVEDTGSWVDMYELFFFTVWI